MVQGLLNFIYVFLRTISDIYSWLNRPFITYDNVPLGFMVLDKLGVDITWIYNTTPLMLIGGSLVTTLTIFLLIKFVGMILDAIPVL